MAFRGLLESTTPLKYPIAGIPNLGDINSAVGEITYLYVALVKALLVCAIPFTASDTFTLGCLLAPILYKMLVSVAS